DRLQPTHIITQTQCKVCAVSLEDVQHALGESLLVRPDIISLEPNALDDIWNDIRRIAIHCGVADTGEQTVTGLKRRMTHISELARTHRPRVACIEWHQPLMAAGNWVPELVELANGENLFGKAGKHSPW